MSKDGFVRDNLIDMRDHLKVAREAILAGNNPHEAARQAEAASTAKNDAKNSSATAPANSAAKNNVNADPRSMREFAGRIIHDRAAVNSAIQAIDAQRGELEEFRKVLDDLNSKLAADKSVTDRQLEQMQFTYYMAAGEYKGSGNERSNSGVSAVNEREEKKFGRIILESLPVMTAIIAAAAIVSLTLLALFA